MKQYFCNPINFTYQYQFNQKDNGFTLNREAADPSLILFKGKYYLFPSMTRGFLVSEDLVNWKQCPLENVPVYDYAPDIRAVGDWMYFCASSRGTICDFYRTKVPESGVFERIPGTFDFWDPNLFQDDDGRLYFYWGCSNMTPIWGVELNPKTMEKIGEPVALIENHKKEYGYERTGENHYHNPEGSYIVQLLKAQMAKSLGYSPEEITDITPAIEATPEQYRPLLKAALSDNPYIEGPWMTKHNGRYYLQYACPGTQFNIYNDAVCVGDSPLGPFTACPNNPFSYSPGGFFPGAGHGSTLEDKNGNWWHTSTMRISVNHDFERRIGIWPAGFDADGELFCNQRYGDWPQAVTDGARDPFAPPEWMLLSYGKKTAASSQEMPAANAVDENVRTWWKTAAHDTAPWLTIDLGNCCRIHAVQINFADDFGLVEELPSGAALTGDPGRGRYIEERTFFTRWLLEASLNGSNWFILEDKRNAETDLTHDLVVNESGWDARYLRLTVTETAYHGPVCVSSLRAFGKGQGNPPAQVTQVTAIRGGSAFGDEVSGADAFKDSVSGDEVSGIDAFKDSVFGDEVSSTDAFKGSVSGDTIDDMSSNKASGNYANTILADRISKNNTDNITVNSTSSDNTNDTSANKAFRNNTDDIIANKAPEDNLSMQVSWNGDAMGYEVLWGHTPEKLYHSYRVFGQTQLEIRALMCNVEQYYIRIDAFNENGITEGQIYTVRSNPLQCAAES